MKEKLKKALILALSKLEGGNELEKLDLKIELKANEEEKFGDYSTNIAMLATKKLSKTPKEIAELLVQDLKKNSFIKKIEIAGPGFINFYLTQESRSGILKIINTQKDFYGFVKSKKPKKKVLIEYVSSNPTGPLHVGHGRGAAYGSVLSNIFKVAGYAVDEEYYVNDRGRQVDVLAVSVWLRYLQDFNLEIAFPKECYNGEYVKLLAKQLKDNNDDRFIVSKDQNKKLFNILSNELKEEKDLDFLVEFVRERLKESFEEIKVFSLNSILESMRKDLKDFGVKHNLWFKESSMFNSSKQKTSEIREVISVLGKNGFTYQKDGALWFRSTNFKDEKDRVVIRENGQTTYFASDIAYHANKFQRGYDKILNVWGADHHGYLPRVKAAMSALGQDTSKFEVIFIQFASLIKGGKKVSMSTRGGKFISLNELMEQVTPEAARFFYINRKANQHLDFDLDLAKEESQDNPLYYVQYAHARICSVFKKLQERSGTYNEATALKNIEYLKGDKEAKIQQSLSQFPEVIERAAENYEPHLICYYLRNLAYNFHSYYNSEKILVENEKELQAKLFMLSAIKQVIFNGLKILGIKSPESM